MKVILTMEVSEQAMKREKITPAMLQEQAEAMKGSVLEEAYEGVSVKLEVLP